MLWSINWIGLAVALGLPNPTLAARKPSRSSVGEQARTFMNGKYTDTQSLESAAQKAESVASAQAEKQFIRLAKDAMNCAALTHDRCILAKNERAYGVFTALVPGLNARFKKSDPQVGDLLGCGFQHLIGGIGTKTLQACGRTGEKAAEPPSGSNS